MGWGCKGNQDIAHNKEFTFTPSTDRSHCCFIETVWSDLYVRGYSNCCMWNEWNIEMRNKFGSN